MVWLFAASLACRWGHDTPNAPGTADVVAVAVDGEPGAYHFAVTVHSPDVGCSAYADWWEIVAVPDQLIHRRILRHSHAFEQPFTRSGGPVAIAADDPVLVRAHLSTGGYGVGLFGTVSKGFQPSDLQDVPPEIEHGEPQPDGCWF